ncbi:hypothetical protein FVE67_08890 [Thermosulfurimonas marina]|uniref:rRNA small subunit methyltransferase F RNA-binding PUA-like domain-containing protein n=1 Tax=Thermosulfurimonas marina TaxID=2047767 RepID=A0A6H1WUN5_9BACT|nr:hypothetical protein [Thermosulfurimonas marina]QJA06898.1 hypothetical protein FVE67_08890 [Thermosulfurimonas marina]
MSRSRQGRKKMDPRAVWPQPVPREEREEVLGYLEARFGIPSSTFEGYELLRTAKNYWLFVRTPHLADLQRLRIQTAGLLFLRKVSEYLKPTSAALQRFGHLATRNVVELDRLTLDRLRLERKIPWEGKVEPGYVILTCEGRIWGCGLHLPGKLISYLP